MMTCIGQSQLVNNGMLRWNKLLFYQYQRHPFYVVHLKNTAGFTHSILNECGSGGGCHWSCSGCHWWHCRCRDLSVAQVPKHLSSAHSSLLPTQACSP